MNSEFVIHGGLPLSGTIRTQGAKNSALPILAAAILTRGRTEIRNCPELTDVAYSLRILRYLGCGVHWENGVVSVDARSLSRNDIPNAMMREMRASVLFLGAILARTGEAYVSHPGGCELGSRPIDIHLSGLRALGAEIIEESGDLICKAPRLTGAEIELSFPSVGATENLMMAATAAEGVTRITNAAKEPEIEDLQTFLRAMGAQVIGAGTSTIFIEGGQTLRDAAHSVIPDRIAAATYLSATALTGGKITLEAVCPAHLSAVTAVLSEAGCEIQIGADTITLARSRPLKAIPAIRTMPYPGFPTDAQSPLMAVAAMAEGTTVFVENIFDNRFRTVCELARLGADIRVEGHVAVVCGVPRLSGAWLSATDLRGGAALVTAALGAEGESFVSGLGFIDRGYERFEQNLVLLGADVRREPSGLSAVETA